MKIVYRIIGTIAVILIINFIATWIFVSKNNGKEYIDKYISSTKEVKIKVISERFDKMFDSYNYLRRILLFRGNYGGSSNYTFKDRFSQKYFKLMRFDPYGDKFSLAQTYKIDNQELYVKVDPLQYNDKKFGTKENSILVFWYKGANKQLTTDIRTDEKDKEGFYINKEVMLSPTVKEHRYMWSSI